METALTNLHEAAVPAGDTKPQTNRHDNEDRLTTNEVLNHPTDTSNSAGMAQPTTETEAPASPTTSNQPPQAAKPSTSAGGDAATAPAATTAVETVVQQQPAVQANHQHNRKKAQPVRADDGMSVPAEVEAAVEPQTNGTASTLVPNAAANPVGGRTASRGGPSRYRGVVWHKSNCKWEARIYEAGKQRFLGYFTIEDEAAMAYDDHAVRLHGAAAKLNFPERYQNAFPTIGDRSAANSRPPVAPKAKAARKTSPPASNGGAAAAAGTGAAAANARRGGFRVQPVKGSSRYRGVSWNSNCSKWRAQVWKGSEVHHLGYFENEEDAARAYDEAVLRIRGPESPTNFPKSDYGVYSEVDGGLVCAAGGVYRANTAARPAARANAAASVPTTATAAPQNYSTAPPPPTQPVANNIAFQHQQYNPTQLTANSPFYGVSWNPNHSSWQAEIWDGERYLPLGAFTTEQQAAREYDLACLEKHGSQALTNFPVAQYEAELAAIALKDLGDKEELPPPPQHWPGNHPYVQQYLQQQQQINAAAAAVVAGQQQQMQHVGNNVGFSPFQQHQSAPLHANGGGGGDGSAEVQRIMATLLAITQSNSLPHQQQPTALANGTAATTAAAGAGVAVQGTAEPGCFASRSSNMGGGAVAAGSGGKGGTCEQEANNLGGGSGAAAGGSGSGLASLVATTTNNVAGVAADVKEEQAAPVAATGGAAAAAAEGSAPQTTTTTASEPMQVLRQLLDSIPLLQGLSGSSPKQQQQAPQPVAALTIQPHLQESDQTVNALLQLINSLTGQLTAANNNNNTNNNQPQYQSTAPVAGYGGFQQPQQQQQSSIFSSLITAHQQQQQQQQRSTGLPSSLLNQASIYQQQQHYQQQAPTGWGGQPAVAVVPTNGVGNGNSINTMAQHLQQYSMGGFGGDAGFGGSGGNGKRARSTAEEQMLALVQQYTTTNKRARQ